jgi:hypothetical protein
MRDEISPKVGVAAPDIRQASIDTPTPGDSRDVHARFRALVKDPLFLIGRPIPPLTSTYDHFDPTIFSFMPCLIHAFKHGISTISIYSASLSSINELISRPSSEKKRWDARRAHFY